MTATPETFPAFCADYLHDGEKVPAHFIVKHGKDGQWAVCEDHVGVVVSVLLDDNRRLTTMRFRRVNQHLRRKDDEG
jgi:hypothetical protein